MVRIGYGIRSGPLVSAFHASKSKVPPVRKTTRLWVRPPCRCISELDIEDSAVESTGVSDDSAFAGADCTSSALDDAFTSESDWEPPATEPINLLTDEFLAQLAARKAPSPAPAIDTVGKLASLYAHLPGLYPYGDIQRPQFDGRLDVDNEFLVPPGCVLPDASGVYLGTRLEYGKEPEILTLPLDQAIAQLSTPELWSTLRLVAEFVEKWAHLQGYREEQEQEEDPKAKARWDCWIKQKQTQFRQAQQNLVAKYDNMWRHQEILRNQQMKSKR